MVKTLIFRAPGTNCDVETGYAFQLAGSKVDFIHINRFLENPKVLFNYQILSFPGGFTFGDYLGAGQIAVSYIKNTKDTIKKFIDNGGLTLGICNGFQILVKMGLLPGFKYKENTQVVTLGLNITGKFIDKWVKLKKISRRCVFTEGIEEIELPIAHAEGKFIPLNNEVLKSIENKDYMAFKYLDNPNGSINDIAALTDKTGRILGMMPHPERNIFPHHHPLWKRGIKGGKGIKIFKNAVKFFS